MRGEIYKLPRQQKAYCKGRQMHSGGSLQLRAEDEVTGTEGANNGLTWSPAGPNGNGVTVALVDPEDVSQALAVTVNGLAVSVSLATGVGGAITTTAAQAIAAIEASAGASALVTVDHTGASNGSAAVAAASITFAGSVAPYPTKDPLGAVWEAGVASWIADPAGAGAPSRGRDECALAYGGGYQA